MIPTKERLAQELHAIGLFELEKAARAGQFSDFETDDATPKITLIGKLSDFYKHTADLKRGQMAYNLARDVMEGKWDDTKEESEA